MANIYLKNGKYTVVVGGIVIGHNLTQAQALRRLEEYDFE
jgi:hypothetical protein